MAEELHLLLDEAAIPGPYVLVGHSLGGVNVRLFAGAHPDEVAGMVLVDSADDPMQLWSLMPPDELAKRKEELRKVPEGIDFDTFVAGTADMRASNRSIGDKPLVVLTRGKADAPPTASPDVAAAWLRRWQEQQSALPRLSTNSVHVVAEKSAHAIHQENPGLVVEAIREVVTAVRDHGRVDAGRLRGIAAS
jgi:pimeloyl-ACP methyl ester carboxylesterase